MNRRQFLTGASAIAVVSALPAAPILAQTYPFAATFVYATNDTPVRFSGFIPRWAVDETPDWRSFCATGEELG